MPHRSGALSEMLRVHRPLPRFCNRGPRSIPQAWHARLRSHPQSRSSVWGPRSRPTERCRWAGALHEQSSSGRPASIAWEAVVQLAQSLEMVKRQACLEVTGQRTRASVLFCTGAGTSTQPVPGRVLREGQAVLSVSPTLGRQTSGLARHSRTLGAPNVRESADKLSVTDSDRVPTGPGPASVEMGRAHQGRRHCGHGIRYPLPEPGSISEPRLRRRREKGRTDQSRYLWPCSARLQYPRPEPPITGSRSRCDLSA